MILKGVTKIFSNDKSDSGFEKYFVAGNFFGETAFEYD